MAWTLVGVGTPASVASGNLTVNEPAGCQAGDLLVMGIAYRSTVFVDTPGDWNLLNFEISGDTATNANGIGSGGLYYCIRGSSAPTSTFTRTGGNAALGCIVAYRGVDSSDPTGTQTTSATLGASGTAVSTVGIETDTNNALIVAMLAGGGDTTVSGFDAATDPSTASGATDTSNDPTAGTWRERTDSLTTAGADTTLAMADAIKATAGVTGTLSCTTANGFRSVMVAASFNMDTGGGPPPDTTKGFFTFF